MHPRWWPWVITRLGLLSNEFDIYLHYCYNNSWDFRYFWCFHCIRKVLLFIDCVSSVLSFPTVALFRIGLLFCFFKNINFQRDYRKILLIERAIKGTTVEMLKFCRALVVFTTLRRPQIRLFNRSCISKTYTRSHTLNKIKLVDFQLKPMWRPV